MLILSKGENKHAARRGQLFHGDCFITSDIDAPEEGDEGFHIALILLSIMANYQAKTGDHRGPRIQVANKKRQVTEAYESKKIDSQVDPTQQFVERKE